MHVLVTGATGYIGKHVLARLLESGHRVTVLVRPQGGRLHARMVDALRPLQPHARPLHELPRITVLAGDITLADCGLTTGDLGVLADAPPEACIHCAGLTRFDAHLAAAIHRHNLDGTRHAHALAKHLGIARFHHLSTAFVAGDTPACFGPGDRDRGQSFHNPYEASKHAAEVYLAAAAQAGDPAIS
ncbi:MAG: SDR family oxidoreductase, partial [Gammaproteobacteria bacterium]